MGQTNDYENEQEIYTRHNYSHYDITESKNIFCKYIILFFSRKQKFLRLFINYWKRWFWQSMESLS